MSPIKETVMPHHRDKNPTDAEVIRRLNAAWAKGQLPWVKTPYWRDGLFTGRKLADYSFPDALDLPPKLHPRRIVNGQDGTDAEVSEFHRQFFSALTLAGWGK